MYTYHMYLGKTTEDFNKIAYVLQLSPFLNCSSQPFILCLYMYTMILFLTFNK